MLAHAASVAPYFVQPDLTICAPQLLDKFGDDADTSGQLRGQVMAAIEELETLEAVHGDGTESNNDGDHDDMDESDV